MNYTYMTIEEAAKYIKVSTDVIYALCRVKGFPAAKVGKRWVIRQDMLDKWWLEQYNDKPYNL